MKAYPAVPRKSRENGREQDCDFIKKGGGLWEQSAKTGLWDKAVMKEYRKTAGIARAKAVEGALVLSNEYLRTASGKLKLEVR